MSFVLVTMFLMMFHMRLSIVYTVSYLCCDFVLPPYYVMCCLFECKAIYVLVKPTNRQVLVIICNLGVEDDPVFGTEHFDFTRGVGYEENKKTETGIYLYALEKAQNNSK